MSPRRGPVYRLIARWGSPGVPSLGLLMVYVGLRLIVEPDQFTAGAYVPAFSIMGARLWGVLITSCAASALVWREPWAVAALVGSTFTWGLLLAYSVLTGDSQSPIAGAPYVAFSLATLVGVATKGTRGIS